MYNLITWKIFFSGTLIKEKGLSFGYCWFKKMEQNNFHAKVRWRKWVNGWWPVWVRRQMLTLFLHVFFALLENPHHALMSSTTAQRLDRMPAMSHMLTGHRRTVHFTVDTEVRYMMQIEYYLGKLFWHIVWFYLPLCYATAWEALPPKNADMIL